MSRILVGTTSWTEKTLVESGRFYPTDVHTAEARLRFYASRFPVVELDSSYYGLPSTRNASLWAERTPDGFVFDVKAFRLFTQHQTPPDALPKDIREGLAPTAKKNLYYKDMPAEVLDELWERFRSALDPLRYSDKLGVVLFQFAPWFVFRPSSLDLIVACAEHLPRDRIAVELRNKSWFAEKHLAETIAFEREHGLIHVVVDEPPRDSRPASRRCGRPPRQTLPSFVYTAKTARLGPRRASPRRSVSTTFTQKRSCASSQDQ
jgi:uncharacterized protein YecE (DUF72 family)